MHLGADPFAALGSGAIDGRYESQSDCAAKQKEHVEADLRDRTRMCSGIICGSTRVPHTIEQCPVWGMRDAATD